MQVKESKWLVKCFLNYLRHDKSEVNVLFDILSIFLRHTRIDFTFLKEFYIIEVCKWFRSFSLLLLCIVSSTMCILAAINFSSSYVFVLYLTTSK